MSVHYKFKAAKEYDTLPIDGLHISLLDLKDAIIHQKRLGKFACDLKVTNAETKEVYADDKDLIPKNTSLIIARIPIDPALRKFGDAMQEDKELLLSNPDYRMNTEGAEEAELIQRKIEEVPDITKLAGTEEEKIAVMMAQSTIKYHPSRYLRLRNTVMSGKVPAFYKCYKCHQGGHWVSNCPLNSQDVRKCTGIPSKFLEEVKDPNAPGVMITATGRYVILRQKSMSQVKPKIRPQYIVPPDDLMCPICKDVLKEAVLIACCANAYCDECIRVHLLDSDLQICPACNAEGIGPDTLIPNRYLRMKVEQFGLQYIIDESVNEVKSQEVTKIGPQKSKLTGSRQELSVDKVSDDEIEVIVPNTLSTIKDLVEVEAQEKAAAALKEAKQKADEALEELKQKANVSKDDKQSTTEAVKDRPNVTSEFAEPSLATDDRIKPTKTKKKKKEKKPKKEKKEKKAKKDKKEKKEKKKKIKNKIDAENDNSKEETIEKDMSSENLMNEAICPTFDTSVPPPSLPPFGSSTNLYDNLGRPDAAIPYGSQYKREIEDTLSPFLDFLRKKDEQKKRKVRSPSPGTRYRSSRSRSRDPAAIYARETGSQSRSPSPNRSRSRSPHQRGSSPYNKRHRRNDQGPRINREMAQREFNQYQGFPPPEAEYYPAEYMDQVNRYPRNPEVVQHYNRGYQGQAYQENTRQFTGYGQPGYPNYQQSEQYREQVDQYREQHDFRRNMHRDYYQDNRVDDSRSYNRGRHVDEGYRPRESRRYDTSKSPVQQERSRESPNRSYKSKEDYDKKHGYGEHSGREEYKRKSKYSSSPDFRREDKRKSNGDDVRTDRDHYKSSRTSRRSRSPARESRRRSRSTHKEISKRSRTPAKDSSKRVRSPVKETLSKNKIETETYGKRARSPPDHISKKKRRSPRQDSPHEKILTEEKKIIKERKRSSILQTEEKNDESKQKEDSKKSKKKKKEKKKKEKIKHKSKSTGDHSGKDDESKNETNSQESLSPVKNLDTRSNVASSNVYIPELSKWERDDDDMFSPIKSHESSSSKDPLLVTSDVLKKAEHALFSKGLTSRNLLPRKVYNDSKIDVAERETKKKGSSIQITISSKTESQIGKPRSKMDEQTLGGDTKETADLQVSSEETKSK